MRHTTPLVCGLLSGMVLLTASLAWAQTMGPPAPLEPNLDFYQQYDALRKLWFFAMFPAANDLFWTLATLEVVLSFILWMTAWFHVDTLAQVFFKKILFISVGYAFLLHADTWLPAMVNSFIVVGKQVSRVELTPNFIFWQGVTLAAALIQKMGFLSWFSNPVGTAIGIVAALLVIVAFAAIAIELAVTLVESYLVMGAGAFLLAFVPFRGTAAITERYLGAVIAVGIKLFVLNLIVGAGTQLAPAWGAYVNSVSQFSNIHLPVAIAFAAVTFFMLAWKIPALAGALAVGGVGLTLHDVVGAAGSALRIATVPPAASIATAGMVRGAQGIAQAAAAAAGGGPRGAAIGAQMARQALTREALAATVPRLQRASERVQQQAQRLRGGNP